MHTRTYVLACARTGGRTRIRVGGVFRTNSNGKLEDEGVLPERTPNASQTLEKWS